MIFRGKRIDAQVAADLGLVSRVVPKDQLEVATRELAADICKSSPVAVREAKRAIGQALGPLDEGIEPQYASALIKAQRARPS